MQSISNIVDTIVNMLKYHFGGFWIVAGLIILLVTWTTTKKALKILATILIVIGVALYAPGLMTGNFTMF